MNGIKRYDLITSDGKMYESSCGEWCEYAEVVSYYRRKTIEAKKTARELPELQTPRVFIDMDGVIVDFDRFRDERGLTGDEVKAMVGAYLDMPAIPGAIEAVRSLIGMGYEVWLATKPPTGIPHAYADKAAWVLKHLPELKRRIIITHDKGLLGGPGDFLCDDRPHKANCEKFAGKLLRFVDGYHWSQALEYFRTMQGKAAQRVSEGMVEVACSTYWGKVWRPSDPLMENTRKSMRRALEAAIGARGAELTEARDRAERKVIDLEHRLANCDADLFKMQQAKESAERRLGEALTLLGRIGKEECNWKLRLTISDFIKGQPA